MAQLGSNLESTFPSQIDTRQIYRNTPAAAPDSDTRLDAEVINGALSAIVNIETTLGANPQGVYGSVAARLSAALGMGGGVPALITFTNATTIVVLGTVHGLGTANLLYQVYDAQTPAQALKPDSVAIDLTSYDFTMTFAAPQSGMLALGSPTPQYRTTFVNANDITIAGNVHNLASTDILWHFTDETSPAHTIEPATFTVNPSSLNVRFTFTLPQSGALILTAASPGYTETFTNKLSVTVFGTTHQLGTRALLYKLYDAATPRAAFEEGSLTVDPLNYDVTLNFLTAQSGTLVLGAAPSLSTQDFVIKDGGVVNSTAVRMTSSLGDLILQAGVGNHIHLVDTIGTPKITLDAATGRLGLGVSPTPSYQLQLSTDSAAKPGTSTWTVASDERLKEVLRPYTDGLALILALEPLWYRYNGMGGIRRDNKEYVGLLAQALQPLAPHMVSAVKGHLTEGDEETDILAYEGGAMTFTLINAVKELSEQLVTMQRECDTLRTQVAGLLQRLPVDDEEPSC